MAETLGSLCDKLTIVKLKQYHTEDKERIESLAFQEKSLRDEIDEFLADAFAGRIPAERLTFASNKVYKREGHEVTVPDGGIGALFAGLADANCKVWHEQEKLYEFENVPAEEKNKVMKNLAVLNLQRNMCIDRIDQQFQDTIARLNKHV